MAKKAILEVLESTIGRYVHNLDAESLNVAVWSGKIELHNLQLDVSAVNAELRRRAIEAPNLACPFRVRGGNFDSVQLDVPWARLSSRPVVFRAKGLRVLMEPHDFLKEEEEEDGKGGVDPGKRVGGVANATMTDSCTGKRKNAALEERTKSIARAEETRQRSVAVRKAWEEDGQGTADDINSIMDSSGDTSYRTTNKAGAATETATTTTSSSSTSTFTSRLVRRILENLQVEVDDVHLAVRGGGCAAGLVLGSLSLVTTDAKGTRTFVDRKTNVKDPKSSFLYKELLISGLGIYLQHDEDAKDNIMRQQRTLVKGTEGATYVLSPLSFQAKLRQSDLDHCIDFPKYLVHSKLSSLSIQLSRTQLELGQRLALTVVATKSEVRPLFPEYRPLEQILPSDSSSGSRGNAKAWWKYAVRCIGRLNRHRSWMEFYAAYRKRKSYLELYKRRAHAEGAPWLTKLLDSENEELNRIENDRSISISGLMLWRTIADAQVTKEREKHAASKQRSGDGGGGGGTTLANTPVKPKSSLLKLFGNTPRKESSDTFYECLDDGEEARPITLTADEMKELEELALKTSDRALTKDSMFCDVNFNLGSFQVNLLTAVNQPITSLEMGMVSASFKANVDGSFTSGLSLLSLQVIDSVTPSTFYPTICQSLQKAHSKKTHAFQFQLKKSQGGDQELVLKMVACEIVASPMLLFAIKEFLKLPNTTTLPQLGSRGKANNPMLYKSVSGDADIFFDAKEGMASTTLLTPMASKPVSHFAFSTPSEGAAVAAVSSGGLHSSVTRDGKVSSKLSSAIMDAWNGKNKQNQEWKIDCDISAPILILPENCTDPNATVLICNFGRFNLLYGTEALSPAVLEWFDSHQRTRKKDSAIDHLNLEMNDLSFTVSSVLEASSKNRLDEMDLDASTSVIEPVSFALNIGLEHTISSGEDIPRTCVIGVLPGIVLRLAPSHVTKILRVAAIWSSNLNTLRGDSPNTSIRSPALLSDVDEEASDPGLEIVSSGSGISILDEESPNGPSVGRSTFVRSKEIILDSILFARQNNDGTNAMEFMHVSVSLLKLSLNIYTDNGDGLEAHLVSVVASKSLITDGTSSSRLSMGWFWILDRLKSELPRRQRLLFHSNLPRSATVYADSENYSEIMNDLTRQGVFKSTYARSADLADISVVKLLNSKARVYHDQSREFSRSYMQSISSNVDGAIIVNAKFSSLFVNWNPLAIKTLFAAKSELLDFKERAYSTYEGMSKMQHRDLRLSLHQDKPGSNDNTGTNSIFILAEMENFEISLNSAQDDLPLFTMTMSGSKVNYHSLEGSNENSEISLVVGDFRMESISSGKILRSYRTILGLAPSVSTSLLTVKYSKGANAVGSSNVGGADTAKCEACAEIVLSPMRFVHIHSQVFTLIEYVSEGVFGAIAASVASSAAAAAMKVAKSSQDRERLFYVVATGFTFVLPQSAYSNKHFSFHAGNFEAHYRALGDDIGSNIILALHDVSMNCSQNLNMVTDPVKMSVVVDLKPPFLPGTEDERATRINMSISRIRLAVCRSHYAQIMHTLDNNIGERDTFLREQNAYRVSENYREALSKADAMNNIIKNLSHAGVENVEVIRRMYIDFHIQELSVKLCRDNPDDPIVSFAAENAHILMKLLPDEKQMKAHLALHDLVCDDRRKGTADRTFRRMFGRANVHELNKDEESEVFLLNYTKYADDGARDIEVKIGSSQLVVLPDVISDMLNFIKIAPISQRKQDSLPLRAQSISIPNGSTHVVVTDDIPNQVEASFESIGITELAASKKTKYQIESSNMRLVLVDLGSIDSSGSFVSTKSSAALNDTIVLQGKMQAKFEMTIDSVTESTVEKDYKIDAERVEIYTAQGVNSIHPVQILEPAKFAIFYYQSVCNKRAEHSTDLKFVTLSPIDLTISMQNAALASTLASSISDSFADEGKIIGDNEFHPLSTTDANRLARLDSALIKDADEPSEDLSEKISRLSSHAGDLRSMRRSIRLKMTSPEATLTVINDFQGLDEALFKISSINAVMGGEISYPGITDNEKPCFKCSLNTSILADYFDAASQRWTMLLTSPWELTLNASRAPQTRTQCKRLSSTFDVESSQCNVSFSEHFLVNLGAASRMWSVYSGATKQANALAEDVNTGDLIKRRLSRCMAACAARSLIATLPYAIENHSGLSVYYSIYGYAARSQLPTNSTQFFRFELFPERGTGGMRRYGQDIKCPKRINIHIGGTEISIHDLDREVNKSRFAYYIPELRVHVFVHVVKRGKSTVLHLSSRVEIHNTSSLPFRISVIAEDRVKDLGIVSKSQKRKRTLGSESLLKESKDLMTYSIFGLPAQLLRSVTVDTSATLCIQISPVFQDSDDAELFGMFNLPSFQRLLGMTRTDDRRVIEVVCSPASRTSRSSSLGANIRCKVTLVDEAHPFVELFIEPRVILRNNIPVSLIARTPMPHTFISSLHHLDNTHGEPEHPNFTTHRIRPLDSVEVFTPGPSIAISLKCADLPIGGTTTGWVDGINFIDIPLKAKIFEPLRCTFPFLTKSMDRYESSRKLAGPASGTDFYVIEAGDVTPDLKEKGKNTHSISSRGTVRIVSFIVCNYAVDHTGTLLFEKVSSMGEDEGLRNSKLIRVSPPYSAFSSTHHRRRVTLLPESTAFIRLVELTMEGEVGMKRSVPFRVEDCSMTEGIDSLPLMWADSTPSGYFAYRNLTAEGNELHVVPEFVIYNGSEQHQIRVMQLAGPSFILEPSKISTISRDRNNSIVVQFEVPAICGLTGPVQIDQVGLRICVVKSKKSGEALGSLAVQTITGARDSRLVVKIGALTIRESDKYVESTGLFAQDFIRFRVRWSAMRVTLKDTKESFARYEENRAAIRKYLEHHNVNSVELERKLTEARHDYNVEVDKKEKAFPDVAQVLLHRFTVDFQRIFKEGDPDKEDKSQECFSNEHAQFSVVVHNVRIIDCSPNTENSVVFDSMSDTSFIDLCIRTRGPLDADLIRVDLFDLNLAYGDGMAHQIVVNTGEDFVWRLLDIANRTMLATAELAGVDLDLKWDDKAGKFAVAISDPKLRSEDDLDADGNYRPPRSDKLYDVRTLRVSPFTLLFSFKRQPQSSRYQLVRGTKGAKLTNYFTTRLKFTVDRADLRFQGYLVRNIKGPPDRIADTIKTVYTAQLKSKIVSLLTATSFQDWKYLTARDSGGEEFIEGDLLRMTGNLAGRTAKFVLKKSGDLIGDTLVSVTGTIGGGIQEATESIGLGQVGAGVNSVVSGLGEGVSSGVKGVGTGAGDIIRGAGKGIGQIIGGLGGGVQIVGKGIAKGDTSEVGAGFATIGDGIGQGVGTAFEGTVSGVVSLGKGLFSGAKSVGLGIGGVFTGQEPPQRPPSGRGRRDN